VPKIQAKTSRLLKKNQQKISYDKQSRKLNCTNVGAGSERQIEYC
jgi:hypothetical protein